MKHSLIKIPWFVILLLFCIIQANSYGIGQIDFPETYCFNYEKNNGQYVFTSNAPEDLRSKVIWNLPEAALLDQLQKSQDGSIKVNLNEGNWKVCQEIESASVSYSCCIDIIVNDTREVDPDANIEFSITEIDGGKITCNILNDHNASYSYNWLIEKDSDHYVSIMSFNNEPSQTFDLSNQPSDIFIITCYINNAKGMVKKSEIFEHNLRSKDPSLKNRNIRDVTIIK